MLKSQTALDRAGATLSVLCAIHCLATPFILVLLPAAAAHSEAAEAWIVTASLLIGLSAMRASWRRNGARLPRAGIACGLAAIVASRLLLHGTAETILVFTGAAILVTAHLFNCRECNHRCDHRRIPALVFPLLLGAACSTALPASAAPLSPAGSPHAVMAAVQAYLGWPYRLGGNSARGVDCSALVQRAFHAIGIDLPRTAAEQFRHGCAVAREELAAGDLVFFHGKKRRKDVSHVGIYIGGERFIHAGKHGVVVASLRGGHWNRRFAGARRLLEEVPALFDGGSCEGEGEGP